MRPCRAITLREKVLNHTKQEKNYVKLKTKSKAMLVTGLEGL
jgi:hypothetical protein